MENTLENKAKFFAQYILQNVYDGDYLLTSDMLFSEGFLELKPLSSISDEDAIEVAKKISIQTFFTKKKWVVNHVENGEASYLRVSSKRSTHMFEIDYDGYLHVKHEETLQVPEMVLPDYLSAYDFLRSKGYALDWNGITVEQQIEYGWIKLK